MQKCLNVVGWLLASVEHSCVVANVVCTTEHDLHSVGVTQVYIAHRRSYPGASPGHKLTQTYRAMHYIEAFLNLCHAEKKTSLNAVLFKSTNGCLIVDFAFYFTLFIVAVCLCLCVLLYSGCSFTSILFVFLAKFLRLLALDMLP